MIKKGLVCCLVLFAVLSAIFLYIYNNTSRFNPNLVVRADSNISAKYASMAIKDSYSVIIEASAYSAEKEWANRIKIAADKLGWKVKIVKKIYLVPENEIAEFAPDFVISLHRDVLSKTDKKYQFKRYMYFGDGNDDSFKRSWYQREYKLLKPKHNKIINYDGFLFAYSGSYLLEDLLKSKGKETFNWVFFAPYMYDYNADFTTKNYANARMYFCGKIWDKLRTSKKYVEFYQLLTDNKKVDLYGNCNLWKKFPAAWKGEIAHNGELFLKKIAEYDVALLLHSVTHLKAGAPTMRIFEAAAVGNIIISDRHKFIMDNFGDSVLYIDESKSAIDMYKQVAVHLDWIKNNPDLALEKAKHSHQIFKDKFTIEKNLSKITKMHEYVLQHGKNA